MSACVDYIRSRVSAGARIAVVLGSGLGAFADELAGSIALPYSEIPDWPRSTAVGHAGKLVAGKLDGVDLLVLSGRAHYYEGYSAADVTFGVRTLGRLGVRTIIFTNAAGGINVNFSQGALVLISIQNER